MSNFCVYYLHRRRILKMKSFLFFPKKDWKIAVGFVLLDYRKEDDARDDLQNLDF